MGEINGAAIYDIQNVTQPPTSAALTDCLRDYRLPLEWVAHSVCYLLYQNERSDLADTTEADNRWRNGRGVRYLRNVDVRK